LPASCFDGPSGRLAALALALSLLAGCPKVDEPPGPETRRYTFRAVAGMSMGAIGASFLAGYGDNHAKFDAVGSMGGPMDATYFLDAFERLQTGGFCTHAQLVALAAENPAALNDPGALDCGAPRTRWYETPQTMNRWRYTANGGDFDRSSYVNLFHDLALGLGNPLSYNADSSFFPHPAFTKAEFERSDLCDRPVVVERVYNREHNPDGSYPAISFCEGQAPIYYCGDAAKTPMDWCAGVTPQAFCESRGAPLLEATDSRNPDLFYARKGVFEPCRPGREKLGIALAVDYNRNGRRDWHEPIIVNARERYRDFGADGCPNAQEDGRGGCSGGGAGGDPNHDDYDLENPLGLEGDGLWEAGEPYDDDGLDGVPGTAGFGDFGEGNGRYDEGPNRARFLATDLRRRYLRMTPAERARLDYYADGGIRDVFNLGLSADHLTGVMRALEPDATRKYTDFLQIPALDPAGWEDDFFYAARADFSRFGRNAFVRYGLEHPTDAQLRLGDGDHVGTNAQVIDRFQTFIMWLSTRWDGVLGPSEARTRGETRSERIDYFSEALGALRTINVALPPGYDTETDRRYPLLLLGHGYGMDAASMANIAIIFTALMDAGDVRPMIIAFPSGRCCYERAGERDCRDEQDDGRGFSERDGWKSQCTKGNFYVNRQGYGPGDEVAYGDAVIELMDVIGSKYRLLGEQTVPVRPTAD
jgi:hypothetical protein